MLYLEPGEYDGTIEPPGNTMLTSYPCRAAMTLPEFLMARWDEIALTARATAPSGNRWSWRTDWMTSDSGQQVGFCVISDPDVAGVAETWGLERGTGQQVAEHIALHDPARVLREVQAKRAILALHGQLGDGIWCRTCDPAGESGDSDAWYPCKTVRLLGQPFSDHPDFRPEWALNA